jgi:SAM-dependent methyltransferase
MTGTIVAGADYVAAITTLDSDRCARAAFQKLTIETVRPGAPLFDFGAGPGIDARFYAERGLPVTAYDVDPRMGEFFASHCGDLIRAGRAALHIGRYEDFIAGRIMPGEARFELVTANFAPLNLVADLHALFARLAALTNPTGQVLASVLSPYFVGDLRYGWWWKNAPRLLRDGRFAVPGAQAPIVRRTLRDFSEQCAPYFSLERVFAAPPPFRKQSAACSAVTVDSPFARLRVLGSRYLFLLFRKRTSSQ